ncbi:MAG: hypothetical protein DI551_10260, partial [Micavibrio aeruginosavorus]
MRFFALLCLSFVLSVSGAHARDEEKAPVKQTINKKAAEEQPVKEEPKEEATEDESAKAEKIAEKPPVDWPEVEGTGIISTFKEGALEKTLWKGQKRSEIEYELARLPEQPKLRALLSLQRRLLLTKTDASLLVNDIGPLRGNDILIQRIKKLMEMGLYDDAWDLYTQKAEEPYDVSITQLGMLLLVMRDDLATACLEEKVFSSKYPADKFFATMDKACSVTMGLGKNPTFKDSAVLQSIYNTETYSIAASNTPALMKMSDLERAFLLANSKIRYDGLSDAVLSKTPSKLLTYFLLDRALPDSAKAIITIEADKRGLKYYTTAIARDENWVKAKAIHAAEPQWPYLESALHGPMNAADLGLYYGDMLSEAKPANLSTRTLLKGMAVFLASGRELPAFWVQEAQKKAAENSLIYIYL